MRNMLFVSIYNMLEVNKRTYLGGAGIDLVQ